MSGAGLLIFLPLTLYIGGCEPSDRGHLHRVNLGGRGALEHAVPAVIQAAPGDGVEFRTVDHRVHTLSFPADSLDPRVRAFLDSTDQRSGALLVTRGSRFILNLDGAPPGEYVFISEGHGGSARGVVEVITPSGVGPSGPERP